MTPGGGAPTLTLTSGITETGKGLYGSGDTGALISTGSKTAVESPPPAKIEDSAKTYAPEQPTEQIPPKPRKESPKAASPPREPPADVTKENVPPPQESIDVVRDYSWTSSVNKTQMIDKIPIIRLKEFKITADNAINAIAAGVFAWGDMQKAGANAVGRMGSLAGAGLTDAASMMGLDGQLQWLKDQKDSKFGDVVASAGGALGNAIDSFVATAKELASRAQPPSDFGPEGQHLMDVYGGLYAREATGRTYTLPYFENDYFSTSNSFSDTTTIPLVGEIYEKLSETANLLPALVEPGVYVQRPQYYNFDTSGNDFSLSITLYNTMAPLEYLKNSKLIQQLILNNLPRRKTRVVVEPPCIYEVLIPGKAFFPYCYISDLRVLHMGTKRLLNGEIVPEAYEVQITIKSLTSDANNFYEKQMQHHEMTFPTSADVTPWGNTSAATSNAGTAGAQREAIAQPAQQALPGAPQQVTPKDEAPSTEAGERAAAKAFELAERNAKLHNGQARDGHHCAAGVKTALLAAGTINAYPGSNADIHAKNAGGWLNNNGYVLTNITDPRKAPIGAVTVYDGPGSGHIDVKSVDRQGKAAYVSDVIRGNPSNMPIKGIYVKK